MSEGNSRKETPNQIAKIKSHIREQTAGYLLAAFGFVAGLAWNEAIKSLIDTLFPVGQNTILAKFTYAILATLIVVIVSGYLTRLAGKEK